MAAPEITYPEIENLICPTCKLTWMCKNGNEKFYFCYACSFILFDKQVEEIKYENYRGHTIDFDPYH